MAQQLSAGCPQTGHSSADATHEAVMSNESGAICRLLSMIGIDLIELVGKISVPGAQSAAKIPAAFWNWRDECRRPSKPSLPCRWWRLLQPAPSRKKLLSCLLKKQTHQAANSNTRQGRGALSAPAKAHRIVVGCLSKSAAIPSTRVLLRGMA